MALDNSTDSQVFTKHDVWDWYLVNILAGLIAPALLGSFFLLCVLTFRHRHIQMPQTVIMSFSVLLVTDILHLSLESYFISQFTLHGRAISMKNQIIKPLQNASKILPGYIQCAISIDRALAVVAPLKVKLWVTWRRMALALIGATVVVLCIETGLFLSIFYEPNPHAITTIHIVYYGVIPFMVQCTCTIIIIVCIYRQRHACNLGSASTNRLTSSDKRIALTLIIIDLLYLTTTVPIMVIWAVAGHTSLRNDVMLSNIDLCKSISAVGPLTDWIVMLWMGKRLRTAALDVLKCRVC